MLRADLADRSAQDVLVLFSMIIGEVADQRIIGSNPRRRLHISFGERPERPYAAADETWLIDTERPASCDWSGSDISAEDIDDLCSHITPTMISDTRTALQQCWAHDGGWTWQPSPATGPEAT